ncbi:MAG TPA: iron-regulated protein [Lutibacter sp.]|nr:iron-regulated protein [Lutibacter sp.]
MKLFSTLFLSFLFIINVQAQKKPAYKLYNAKGKKTSYKKLLKQAKKADVVLFGEFHNNPISHWLQYEFTKDMNEKRKLVLGFEMLESDNQNEINSYLEGKINQKALDTLARLWGNYKTDYKPLVDFAKDNKLDVCACNVPRRYASMVFKGGFEALDTLPNKEKDWIAPLPFPYDATLASYVAMTNMEHMNHMPEKMKQNMPKAQAIKDATMAHFILENLKKRHLMIHYNGAYHSNDYEGIMWYLKKYRPELKILTITTESVSDVKKFNKENAKADFIIQVDENMTSTY